MFAVVAVGARGKVIYEKVIMCAQNDHELPKEATAKCFVDWLLSEEKFFKKFIKEDLSLPPTPEDMTKFFADQYCCICEGELDFEKDFQLELDTS